MGAPSQRRPAPFGRWPPPKKKVYNGKWYEAATRPDIPTHPMATSNPGPPQQVQNLLMDRLERLSRSLNGRVGGAASPAKNRLLPSAGQAVSPATAKVEGPSTPALKIIPTYEGVWFATQPRKQRGF
jgi:hypothetical protein